jgi:hypothetical protein
MKITKSKLKQMIREGLNEVGDPYDGVYNNLHDALVAVHNVFKKQKVDNKTMGAFRKWWDQLDGFYPGSWK